ncbi:MAG: hypothetical protein ACPK7O_07195 [Methanobacterium sp.]
MPYLICDKCDIYYEIEEIKEMNELSECECGNKLQLYETIDDYMNLEEPREEENQGIFNSVSKKNLVYLQMNMLKEQKEAEERERKIRDLKYRIRHTIANRENDSNNKSIKLGKNLKNKKELLLREMELLIKSRKEK